MPSAETAAARAGGRARSVVVAVLTFRRPDDLAQALPQLAVQACAVRSAEWTARLLVVDNDPAGSAREAVLAFAASAAAMDVPVEYVNETEPGISAARNAALDHAGADDILVFIDDDERPSPEWLRLLLDAFETYRATAVVGPVVSEYEVELSDWVREGRFFDRRRLPTGTPIDVAATNNLLLDLAAVRRMGLRFDPQFGLTGGGDTLFTLQLIDRGGTMVWCDEAIVVDVVPRNRTSRDWVLRRALRSGNHRARTSSFVARSPLEKLGVRSRFVVSGSARVVAGGARAALGLATGSMRHQARGTRTLARGSGMVLGALGYTYSEYRRK